MQNDIDDPLAPPADASTPQTSATTTSGTATSAQQPVGTAPGTPQQGAAPLPKDHSKLARIISIIIAAIFGITAVIFIGLFIWKNSQYTDSITDVNGQIEEAVSQATSELETQKEKEFNVEYNYPLNDFAAEEDYGSLSFKYPKTWSVYVAKSAKDNKGDYEAYLNPGVVNPVSATTINAVRVTIKNQTFEKTLDEYDKFVKKDLMTVEERKLDNDDYPDVKGETYYLYRGELPSKLRGAVAIFKVRDKVCILQTDAEVFLETNSDQHIGFLDPVLQTVHYNK